MSMLEERLELVNERLAELAAEEKEPFWQAVFGLFAGAKDAAYLSFPLCREMLGAKRGVILCVFYAGLYQQGSALFGAGEVSCLFRELTVELRLMAAEGEDDDALRNTLYWFYLDNLDILTDAAAALEEPVFGGPSCFFSAGALPKDYAEMHRYDFALFWGSRYAQGLLRALDRLSFPAKLAVPLLAADLRESGQNGSFLLTGHQIEIMTNLRKKIRQ